MMNISAELSKFEVGSIEYKFFEKVFEKLGSNFVRKSVEEKQREARSKLNKAIEKYFQLYIFSDAVFKSAEHLEKFEANEDLNCLSEVSSNIHSMYLNMVRESLPLEESPKPKPFGLSQEKVLQMYEFRDSESRDSEFKELIEHNINEFCKSIILCTGGTILPGENWQTIFERTIKDLESKVTLVFSKETKEQTQKQLREMTQTYYEELSKGISLLNKTLSLHDQKLEFESALGEFYLQRCNAVLLKIKYCELKVLQATYNHETIPALKKISSQLDQSEEKLKEEQNEKTVALESYLKLGDEYKRCVEEYAHLTKSIKEQQWAIDELKSKKTLYDASGCD